MSNELIRMVRPFHYVGSVRALRVGVTGGIGAGKTTVTETLARLGAKTVAADDLSRSLQDPGGAAVAPIARRFSDAVITAEGGVDRAALAAIVFADEGARSDLEHIMHPLIAREAHQFLGDVPAGTVAVYDVPLLVETHTQDYLDAIIVVWADLVTRLNRLIHERGMTREAALARVGAQASDAERERIAHAVVTNTDERGRIEAAIEEELWPELQAAMGQ